MSRTKRCTWCSKNINLKAVTLRPWFFFLFFSFLLILFWGFLLLFLTKLPFIFAFNTFHLVVRKQCTSRYTITCQGNCWMICVQQNRIILVLQCPILLVATWILGAKFYLFSKRSVGTGRQDAWREALRKGKTGKIWDHIFKQQLCFLVCDGLCDSSGKKLFFSCLDGLF